MTPTRVDGTEFKYLKRAKVLVDRYGKETGESIDKIEPFAHWLVTILQPTIVKSTWRYDRAALVFYLKDNDYNANSIFIINKLGNELCKKGSIVAGASKQKYLSDKDIEVIALELDSYKNKWDGLVLNWLEAAVVAGLRPSEWETALLKGDCLVVINAKNTNGRCFGHERGLNLSNLDEASYDAIEKFLLRLKSLMNTKGYEFEYIYRQCRMRLRCITARLWPRKKKHPTLYSCRHQFSADMKNIFSKKEVAALMGHGSDATATVHYGKKRDGNYRKNHVTPDPEQVALVKEELKKKEKSQQKQNKS